MSKLLVCISTATLMSVVVCVTYFNLATNIHFNTANIDVQNSCVLYPLVQLYGCRLIGHIFIISVRIWTQIWRKC